ncbi:MAG: SRPBCC domain-containing protein [Streptosporangiaceae bacterium]
MGHAFEHSHELTVPVSPEQAWEAIATGPGIDSWFMGRSQIADGTVRTAFLGYTPEAHVTVSQEPSHFAYDSERGEGGRFVAYEFMIEGREGGSTVIRTVTSGFLPGDDWEAEYDAMLKGFALFYSTLGQYLERFPGRTATPVTAMGPPVTDWDRAWEVLRRAIGLPGPARVGDVVRFGPDGLPPVDGVVYFVNDNAVAVSSSDAQYRFVRGFNGSMMAMHQLFAGDAEEKTAEQGWSEWLERIYSPSA